MTKTTVKQISTVAPEYVTAAVKNFTEAHRMRNISFDMIADGGTLYLDEDARYTFFPQRAAEKHQHGRRMGRVQARDRRRDWRQDADARRKLGG
jgi:hypothetical protein